MEGEQNNVHASGGKSTGSIGSIISIIVILAILILGGLYFWGQRIHDKAVIDGITIQSSSDETSAIEADLNATDVENLDAELNAS